MITMNKFNAFVQFLGTKTMDLATDTLKVMLTDTTPDADMYASYQITDIAAGHGYTAGGSVVTGVSWSQTGGVAALTADDPVFTASGGSIGPFRYAVLYDSQPAGTKPLIGWWDYGSEVTLASGQSFTLSFDPTNGILTLS